jgi:transcriptional regulator with XRE-family HTH domain
MDLGQIIKKYRRENHMTMQEFADRCELSKGYISMLEKGQHPQRKRALVPSLETFVKLSGGMNMSVQELFSILDIDDWIEYGFDIEQAPADRELLDILEELRSRDDMRMLFKLARGASPDDVRRAAAIIEALRKQD